MGDTFEIDEINATFEQLGLATEEERQVYVFSHGEKSFGQLRAYVVTQSEV